MKNKNHYFLVGLAYGLSRACEIVPSVVSKDTEILLFSFRGLGEDAHVKLRKLMGFVQSGLHQKPGTWEKVYFERFLRHPIAESAACVERNLGYFTFFEDLPGWEHCRLTREGRLLGKSVFEEHSVFYREVVENICLNQKAKIGVIFIQK